MARNRSLVRWGSAALFGLFVLSACTPEAPQNLPLDQLAPDEIFRLGEFELETGNPTRAADFFGEVERLFPFSEWAKRGLIMQAFSYHSDQDYDNSRSSAQRYLDFYPADEDAAYAQYLLALSYYEQIDDVGRDQGLTFQALQSLRTVIETYPESEFARSSILKFDLAFDHLGGKEMEVGRFYLKRGNYLAAVSRFRVVVEQFETTTHTPEALYRLVESYLALGLDEEAQTAGAILGFNFRATEWYADAYALLTGEGLRPSAEGTGFLRTIWRQTVRGEWL